MSPDVYSYVKPVCQSAASAVASAELPRFESQLPRLFCSVRILRSRSKRLLLFRPTLLPPRKRRRRRRRRLAS